MLALHHAVMIQVVQDAVMSITDLFSTVDTTVHVIFLVISEMTVALMQLHYVYVSFLNCTVKVYPKVYTCSGTSLSRTVMGEAVLSFIAMYPLLYNVQNLKSMEIYIIHSGLFNCLPYCKCALWRSVHKGVLYCKRLFRESCSSLTHLVNTMVT